MPRHKSAVKQLRQSLRKNAVNKKNKSRLRSEIRNIKTAIKNGDAETAAALLPKAMSVIDKSVKKKTIPAKKGDRYKSRLSRKVRETAVKTTS